MNAHTGASLQERGEPATALSTESLTALVGPSPWLVVVPHDDDLVLGSGMLLALAAEAGIEVHVAVCTDGSLGYADPADRGRIGAIRRAELEDAMGRLGLDPARAHYLGFRDGSLARETGARPAPEPAGLGQALSSLMRRLGPGAVFSCHEHDVHPDHLAVAQETAIACFWASSAIWLEQGPPVSLPNHLRYGVYVAFEGPPDVRLVAREADLERKLHALEAFASQSVIEALVERMKHAGPLEYFQRARFRSHDQTSYAGDF